MRSSLLAMIGSPWQLIVIALIILVLFGGSRLGELGKGLGEGIKNFKKGISDGDKPDGDKPDADKLPPDEGQKTTDAKVIDEKQQKS